MAFWMLSLRDRNLILGKKRVFARGGVTSLLTMMSLPTMMKTLKTIMPSTTTMTMRTTLMVKMMTPTDWTTPPLTMTTTTSNLMLISRNLS